FDGIAVQVESPLVKEGRLAIQIHFPYGTGEIKTADWTKPEAHETVSSQPAPNAVEFQRKLDNDAYYAAAAWSPGAELKKTGSHQFEVGFGAQNYNSASSRG